MSNDIRYKKFQNALISARQSAGLTQADVSAYLNKNQSFVSKYESGERRLDIVELIDISKVLGIDPITIIKKTSESL